MVLQACRERRPTRRVPQLASRQTTRAPRTTAGPRNEGDVHTGSDLHGLHPRPAQGNSTLSRQRLCETTEEEMSAQSVGQGCPAGWPEQAGVSLCGGHVLVRLWKDTELGALSLTLWRVNRISIKLLGTRKQVGGSREHLPLPKFFAPTAASR